MCVLQDWICFARMYKFCMLCSLSACHCSCVWLPFPMVFAHGWWFVKSPLHASVIRLFLCVHVFPQRVSCKALTSSMYVQGVFVCIKALMESFSISQCIAYIPRCEQLFSGADGCAQPVQGYVGRCRWRVQSHRQADSGSRQDLSAVSTGWWYGESIYHCSTPG